MMWRALFLALAIPGTAGAAIQADTPAAAPDAPLPPVVSTQPTLRGVVFADTAGRTLYQSDRDGAGKSACQDACLKDWTPVAAAWVTGGIGDWTVITRADGSRQWAYKDKPVYTYNGDRKVGDAKGVEADSAWHPLMKSAKFLPPNVVIRSIPYSNLPPALATADGKTLYLLDKYKFNPQGTSGTTRSMAIPARRLHRRLRQDLGAADRAVGRAARRRLDRGQPRRWLVPMGL